MVSLRCLRDIQIGSWSQGLAFSGEIGVGSKMWKSSARGNFEAVRGGLEYVYGGKRGVPCRNMSEVKILRTEGRTSKGK